MVETVLLTLAPYVLDTLLGGEEDVQDFHVPTKMYRGGLYSGAGYRYPKTIRSIVVEYPQEFAKAAIYNKAIAEENPWVNFLRQRGVYEEIGALLREARDEYRKTHPESDKTRKSKQSRIRRLEGIKSAIEQYKDALKEGYTYKVPYDQVVAAEISKLQNEIDRLRGVQQQLKLEKQPMTQPM